MEEKKELKLIKNNTFLVHTFIYVFSRPGVSASVLHLLAQTVFETSKTSVLQ